MKKLKQSKGITLIALIITIIILLILAGVTINVLIGDNGLFKTAKTAGEEYIKSQLKEELEIEIANIQSKKIANEEELSRKDLLELEEIGAIMFSVDVPAEGNYKNYNFTINENYEVTIGINKHIVKPKIELTNLTEVIANEVTIKVKVTIEEGTIEEVIKPDGTTTTDTEFEYKVKENKTYVFEAKGSNRAKTLESIEITNVKETAAKPIIKSNYGYPTLTLNGIINDGTTTIIYDNTKANLENFYSLDNGVTWIEYTGPFNITTATTIKAKSMKNGNVLSESSVKVSIPSDAVGPEAYDNNTSNYVSFPDDGGSLRNFKIRLSEDVVGHIVQVELVYLNGNRIARLAFGYEDGSEKQVYYTTDSGTLKPQQNIPSGAKWLIIGIQWGRGISSIKLIN